MDVITMLRDDHKAVRALFRKYEATGDDATKTRQKLVEEITQELLAHAAAEEQVFYAAVKRDVPSERDDVLEGHEEHRVAERLLDELSTLPPDDETFHAKVTVLIEAVRHHVKEEEDDLFPAVRAEIDRKTLKELGEAFATAKAAHRARVAA
jgi:hemerythrin superfamily protein